MIVFKRVILFELELDFSAKVDAYLEAHFLEALLVGNGH